MTHSSASADHQTAVNRESHQPMRLAPPHHPTSVEGMSVTPDLPPTPRPLRVRFGVFEADLRNRELRKQGFRVRLQQKPFQVLEMLLERPGELVTREQLAARLWPGVFVSFERSLNTAVNSLRRILCDSRRSPRYIETRAGLGYVFIAPVQEIEGPDAGQQRESEPAIGILPFHNAGGGPAAENVAEALARAAVESLSAVHGLRVIARSTSFRFRGDTDILSAGRQLNARALLTGAIAPRGDAFAVEAELVDVRTGARLWGAAWDGMPQQIPAAAAEITAAAARMFNRPVPAPAGVQQDTLRGRWFCDRLTEDDLHRAAAHFDAALAQAPRFAPACAGLAETLRLFAVFGVRPPCEVRERAGLLASAAVESDARLSEAHASLAQFRRSFSWDWDGSEAECRIALELDASAAPAHRAWAAHLAGTGRFDEAVRAMRRARECDPMSLVVHVELAWILCLAGDFSSAAEASWQALALEPRFAPAQNTLGIAYQHMGMLEEALVEFRNAVSCSGQHPAATAALAHATAVAANPAAAREMLATLRATADRRYVSPWWMAIVHAGLGEIDAAFDALHAACEERDVWLVWLGVEPRLSALRRDPRFAELLRTVGLTAAKLQAAV